MEDALLVALVICRQICGCSLLQSEDQATDCSGILQWDHHILLSSWVQYHAYGVLTLIALQLPSYNNHVLTQAPDPVQMLS